MIPIGSFLVRFCNSGVYLSRSVIFLVESRLTIQFVPIGKTLEVSIKTPKDLGSVIRERRKKAKLTQKRAAALAGVGVRFLSELERGKPTAQIGKTLKVAQLLGLELRINERR